MPDYSKTVIYKIQHIDDDKLLYIGSTCNFTIRKSKHKYACTQETKNGHFNVYQMIRDNGGWESFNMLIIKEFPCLNKQEALIEEDRIIRELKASMNTRRAFTTDEEKRIQQNECNVRIRSRPDYKDKIKEQNKQYRENNKEKIAEQRNSKVTCECGMIISHKYIETHKKTDKHRALLTPQEHILTAQQRYYQTHSKTFKTNRAEYHKTNREHILEQNNQKVTCECGSIVSKSNLCNHKKTKKHIENI